MKVFVDTSKPLATRFLVPRKDLPKTWAFLKYEKLQGFCYGCGLIGHEQKNCKQPKAMVVYNPKIPKYTQNLGVSTARTLASIAGGGSTWIDNGKYREKSPVSTGQSTHEDAELRY